MVITDRYPLVQSKQFNLKPNEEARVDLVLKKRPPEPKTKLKGQVTNDCLGPINKATVKVLDRDYNPVIHTLTNSEGKYVIKNILPPGDYKLIATADGYLTSKTTNFFLHAKKTKLINIELITDPWADKGVVYGLVTDALTRQPIIDASVMLLDTRSRLTAQTTSNPQGQYLVNKISPGQYSIITSKPGYVETSILVIVEQGLLKKINLQMYLNPETSLGTISGLIKDKKWILSDACVGLYAVIEGTETLIQTETTNNEGLYLFTNVASGQYLVKAKLESGTQYCEKFQV